MPKMAPDKSPEPPASLLRPLLPSLLSASVRATGRLGLPPGRLARAAVCVCVACVDVFVACPCVCMYV